MSLTGKTAVGVGVGIVGGLVAYAAARSALSFAGIMAKAYAKIHIEDVVNDVLEERVFGEQPTLEDLADFNADAYDNLDFGGGHNDSLGDDFDGSYNLGFDNGYRTGFESGRSSNISVTRGFNSDDYTFDDFDDDDGDFDDYDPATEAYDFDKVFGNACDYCHWNKAAGGDAAKSTVAGTDGIKSVDTAPNSSDNTDQTSGEAPTSEAFTSEAF
jgi:hypothetical protein